MEPLPHDFLKRVAQDYGLTPGQTDALVKRLGDRNNEHTDAEVLGITGSALRSRMTAVY
ncbi:MAG: hypothetical protein F6K16_29840, partial [Symploca sp. SIO2B6]|nr:hypothetical protein [Symploca sp. SIO2B6]